jgi:hypothetical protein
MGESVEPIITRWMGWRGQTEPDLRRALDYPDEATLEEEEYIWSEGLSCLYDEETFAGHLYFRDGRLALIYIEYPGNLYHELTPEALSAALGAPAVQLQSRAGDQHIQHIYPEQGIAYSADPEEVSFIEIFTPTTLDDYRAQYYMEPPEFKR